jgi:hypothetical protein
VTTYHLIGSQALDFPTLPHADGVGIRLEPGDTIELDAEPVEVFDTDGETVIERHYPGSVWLVPVDDDKAADKPASPPTPPTAAAPQSASPSSPEAPVSPVAPLLSPSSQPEPPPTV